MMHVSSFFFILYLILPGKMSEKFELNTFAECRFDTSDQDDYEAPSPGRNAENEYVSIKDIAEGGMQQYNAVHNNTSMCIGSSECNNTRTQRSYRRTQPDGPDANEEIKAISKRLAETATALKRLKIICIALGVALVMISVTIGALMLIMVRLHINPYKHGVLFMEHMQTE